MNRHGSEASLRWYLLGALFLLLAWIVLIYVPLDDSWSLALLLAMLGVFALWQSWRVASIYRKGGRLIAAGTAIILAMPVLAKNSLIYISKLAAEFLGDHPILATVESLSAMQQVSLSLIDVFLAIVGFGLVLCGIKYGKETTEIVRIDESADSIKNRVKKSPKN